DQVVRARVLRGDVGGADDDLRAVRLEHVALVLTDLVRQYEDAAVPLELGHQGQPDAGVTAGWFDDRAARAQQAGLLGLLHHAQGDAVLDATARVEVLDLGEN